MILFKKKLNKTKSREYKLERIDRYLLIIYFILLSIIPLIGINELISYILFSIIILSAIVIYIILFIRILRLKAPIAEKGRVIFFFGITNVIITIQYIIEAVIGEIIACRRAREFCGLGFFAAGIYIFIFFFIVVFFTFVLTIPIIVQKIKEKKKGK
jgi:hypothetical protein